MDEQTDTYPLDPLSSEASQLPPNSGEATSRSVPNLRFPRPQGSLYVADWVSGSSPHIMASAHSTDEDSGLSESSFEFIARDIDENSQDDRTDTLEDSLYEQERLPHPDEVQAFGGSDDVSTGVPSSMATDFESEAAEEDNESHSAVHLPSKRTSVEDDLLTTPFTQSSVLRPIEFREPQDVDIQIDKISVKHTIKEFSESEAASLIEDLDLNDSLDASPRRLSATIRQTMSQRCLSTHEAFRVLYVGDEAVKGEIILKISRAITCSSSVHYNENKTLRRNTEGVYNIVPVSFGPSMDLDVELMEASAFQIKVDTCVNAEEIPIQGGYFREDIVYSLTVDGGNGGKTYKSVPAGGPEGFRVQPSWTLPHLVVIFCSEDDSEHTQKIQDATRTFCKRHAVPTVYISDHPAFMSPVAKRWLDCTHAHAVHLSLQSRELKTEHRFPIDLANFLNIDNRQMNQNLAYLTGLEEVPASADEKTKDRDMVQESAVFGHQPWNGYIQEVLHSFAALRDDERLYPILMCALFAMLTSILGIIITTFVIPSASPSSERLAGVLVPGVSTLNHNTPPAATATITVSHTSTKTVRVATIETPSFGGLLSDIAYTVSAETPKSTACFVEVYSSTEILIKMPVGTKESWLAKGAIDIDVFRGGNLIPTRLSTSDEGIIVQIPFKESHGILNVSIVTTRKPKMNETFAINFGSSPRLYEVLDAVKSIFGGAFKVVEDHPAGFAMSADGKLVDKAASWWAAIQDASKTAQAYSAQVAKDTYGKLQEAMDMEGTGLNLKGEVTTLLKDTQRKFQNHLNRAEDVREDVQLALLRAQISSKLWWLKLRGKSEEREYYERLARDFLINQHAQVLKERKVRNSPTCPQTGATRYDCKDDTGHTGRWRA